MLWSGLCLVPVGAALILSMSLPLPVRILAGVLWLVAGSRDIDRYRRAYRRYRGLRLDCEGRLELRSQRGDWRAARLLPGSLVLRRFGWIRVCDERGRVFAEPVRGHCRDGPEWRRLQVLWRHVGALS